MILGVAYALLGAVIGIGAGLGVLVAQGAPPASVLEWIDTGGLVALLTLGVWAFLTGRIVPKGSHERELEQRDETIARLLEERNRYLELALRSTRASEQATTVMQQTEAGELARRIAEELRGESGGSS